MAPEILSAELRERHDHDALRRRRGIIVTSYIAGGCMQLIGLYQMGLIRHLPEPPLPRLNADEVDAAPEAYKLLHTPDAFLGWVSYAATAALAAASGPERAQHRPWLPLALGVKVLIDAAQAAHLTRQQWTKHRAFCSWCLIATAATFAAVPLAMPEALDAARHLASRRSRLTRHRRTG